MGALPIRMTLQKQMPHIDTKCSLCRNESETIEHLLISCHFSRAIWFVGMLGIQPDRSILSFDGWLELLSEKLSKEQLNYAFNTMWLIWKARNKDVFDREEQHQIKLVSQLNSLNSTTRRIVLTSCMSLLSQDMQKENNSFEEVGEWGFMCFVDAAWKGSYCGGVGIYLVSKIPKCKRYKSVFLSGCDNALVGEAHTLLLGIKEAMEQDEQFGVIFSDCFNIRKAVNDSSEPWIGEYR
ncbi:uncharacterized protein [Typha latifolia]|uniref:uncharacterized protein n=1 Tax=Typha latifolia TaxID=4733 RepID=UPI003C2E017B